ncbi:rRNA pseudouridine synthase, partial [bacterium]|nr:rRNA pseudouridine synthase [bacterium]
MKTEKLVRISKYLSEQGICSRRKAEELLAQGMILVDGEKVTEQGTKINPETQKVKILEEAKQTLQKQLTIIFNKPVGYVSNLPEGDEKEAKDLIKKYNYNGKGSNLDAVAKNLDTFSVVGRLDKDSHGLLIFTQDGAVAKKIIGEASETEKEYHVRVKGEITNEKIRKMSEGMILGDLKLKPCKIRRVGNLKLIFILKEGKKHQIRKMCEKMHLFVEDLFRVRIGNIKIGSLPEGKWEFV